MNAEELSVKPWKIFLMDRGQPLFPGLGGLDDSPPQVLNSTPARHTPADEV
ncbi:MAG TPA: hypothetical protein H9836_18015 [Candidatus Nocardiopsis merdipullorum]|nr:hypothetical protein [Candidatus Nocardiopsis merdipullorum]